MTKRDMQQLGSEYAKAGKSMTPYDLRAVDADIFAAATGDRAERAKFYRVMRGAFNRGWMAEHARIVGVL